ncbi:MAG TPA: hypothetical protein H9822_07750 [Candidatus Yaniella excrementavium]|nr:hypothetical protein [Candidatus Yaniella excrementavium]
MTAAPKIPATLNPGVEDLTSEFPVGGADPDLVAPESSKPAICAVPMLGKMLSQCK